MNIKDLINQLGGNRSEIADRAGISIFQLNNMISKNVDVEQLANGEWITVRKNAPRFTAPIDTKTNSDKL